jgi:hypothetical protein
VGGWWGRGKGDECKQGQHLNSEALSKEAWFKGSNATNGLCMINVQLKTLPNVTNLTFHDSIMEIIKNSFIHNLYILCINIVH